MTRILAARVATEILCVLFLVGAAAVQAPPPAASTNAPALAPVSARIAAIDTFRARVAKTPEAVDSIRKYLKDSSPQVRTHAARTLGQLGEAARSAVPDLVLLLKDADDTVRRQAVA